MVNTGYVRNDLCGADYELAHRWLIDEVLQLRGENHRGGGEFFLIVLGNCEAELFQTRGAGSYVANAHVDFVCSKNQKHHKQKSRQTNYRFAKLRGCGGRDYRVF